MAYGPFFDGSNTSFTMTPTGPIYNDDGEELLPVVLVDMREVNNGGLATD